MNKPKVIIVPGNGCTPIRDANWYKYMYDELIKCGEFSDVKLEEMPDPYEAKECIWLPFILNTLGADENTIVIGHSSGAVATLRLLENNKLFGCVLISCCYTDLGEESEAISGYYSRPWLYDNIKSNSKFIIQYHSTDDPFIPRHEADHVAANINSNYTCYTNKSHFFTSKDVKHIIPELLLKINEINK